MELIGSGIHYPHANYGVKYALDGASYTTASSSFNSTIETLSKIDLSMLDHF